MSLLWDSPRGSLPPLSPISPTSPSVAPYSRRPRHIRRLCHSGGVTIALITAVCLSGVFLALVLLVFVRPPPDGRLFALPFSRPGRPEPERLFDSVPSPAPAPPQRKHDDDHLDLEELQDLIAQTKGYLVRDYSLGLGWNNVRYIIEAAVLQAQLLNRTLVIPSFIYARSCEYDIVVCADYAPMVNKNDAIGWDEWRDLPLEKQMAWRIPITMMFNLTHLRHTHPVILTSEYLRLHNLPADVEESSGTWSRALYHEHPNVFESDPEKKPSLQVIENWWYDPRSINRVDILPADMKVRGNWSDRLGDPTQGQMGGWGGSITTTTSQLLHAAMAEDQSVLPWEEARNILRVAVTEEVHNNDVDGNSPSEDEIISNRKMGRRWDVLSDEEVERTLRLNGWEVLYTYSGALDMEYVKHVTQPIRQVAPRRSLRGFKDDFDHLTADVVLLSGELHLGRKPGGLRFATSQKRETFSRIVLQHMRPIDKILDLAGRLDERMLKINGGRMWMAAHMRRGDFVKANWVMEQSIEDHLDRVQDRLAHGRQILSTIREPDVKAYDVPDVTVDRTILHLDLPSNQDKFYIATDERDYGNLTYLVDHGAVLANDLLTIEDRRQFGWPLMITDVLGVLEQATLAHAAYFYAHAMSSVAGGVINMRAARGADPRTALVD